MRPARSTDAPEAAANWAASGDAWTPAAHTTVRAGMRSVPPFVSTSTPSESTLVTRAFIWSSTPRRRSSRAAAAESRSPNAARGSFPPSTTTTRTVAGIDRVELSLETSRRELADLPCNLDAGGTCAHDDEGEPLLPLPGIGGGLGEFQGTEDSASELHGVVDRLHARREQRELVVTEVGLTGTGGHDQAVVRELDAVGAGRPGRVHDATVEIEPVDLEELDGDARDAAQHVSQRRRDVARREHAGRHLVEQRLEEMVVASVDQRHVDALDMSEEACSGQAAEAASDDDHVVRHSPSMCAPESKACSSLFISPCALREHLVPLRVA